MKEFLRKFQNVLMVSYEAGGAQILSSIVSQFDQRSKFQFCLDGPAKEIFKFKLGSYDNLTFDSIYSLNPATDFVLTGTSFIPDLERNAIEASRKHGILSAAFIDHWANYVLRFVPVQLHASKFPPKELAQYLPDYVIVSDGYQYRLALDEGIPREKLLLTENYYFLDIRQELSKRMNREPPRNPDEKKRLLYLSEPVFDDVQESFADGMAWGYSEWDVVEALIRFLETYQKRLSEVIFRLHPNETFDKYNHMLGKYGGKVNIRKSKGENILDDIVRADLVLGIESMGLVVALLCGRQVFSYLPSSTKRKRCLPHREINHISKLDELWEKMER